MSNPNIFLSIGHNPSKQGFARKDGTTEHDTAAQITAYLYQYLYAHGHTPILVPTGSLKEKVNFVNEYPVDPDDLLIEIHLNAFNGKAQGSEVLSNASTAVLSAQISESLARALQIKNRGVKPLRYHNGKPLYISKAKCKVLVIECFFMDTPDFNNFSLKLTGDTIARTLVDAL